MKYDVPLSAFRDVLSYSPETGLFIWLVTRGRMAKAGSVAGTINTSGHRQIKFRGNLYLAHKLAWLFSYGDWPPKGKLIDHINCNKDDNRLANLRLCTRRQNNMNGPSWGACRYRGVCKRANSSGIMWRAYICVDGARIHLGSFKNETDAEKAYDKAALKYFGEFARPNLTPPHRAKGPQQ